MAAIESPSAAALRLRNGGSITSASAGAGNGPSGTSSGVGAMYTALLP